MRQARRATRGAAAVAAACGLVLTATAPPAAVAAPAEGEIRNAGAVNGVPESYLVVLKDDAALGRAASVAAELTGRHGGTVVRTYRSALNGFQVTMTERQARRLAADPRVAQVEQDAVISVNGTQHDPEWGLDRIDQRDLPLDRNFSYGNEGAGVTAYVIDTGIRTTHQDFGGRATSGYDFVDNDTDATDCAGHGTHVAGTIGGTALGVAKQVELVGVRVLNCQGRGSLAQVISGVEWVARNARKPAVVNMSLGDSKPSATLEQAVANAIRGGLTFTVSAGNDGVDACTATPARVPEAITVGASDDSDVQAGFSNHGACVDLYAPGVAIRSAWHTGDTATNTINGTSMAAPHVAGVVALHLNAEPGATPQQVREALVAAATKDKLTGLGAGSPNSLLHTTQPG